MGKLSILCGVRENEKKTHTREDEGEKRITCADVIVAVGLKPDNIAILRFCTTAAWRPPPFSSRTSYTHNDTRTAEGHKNNK